MYVFSYAPYGAEGIVIRVEADIRRGIPGVDLTGLADGAVREARERVRAAFRNSGFQFPLDRVLVNLAPAGLRKEGAALDLPIAIAVMAAAGLVPNPENLMVLGELELSGRLRPVRGVLPATAAGLKEGVAGFIVPLANAAEAAILAQGCYSAVASLKEAAHVLQVRASTGVLPNLVSSMREMDGDTRPDPIHTQVQKNLSVMGKDFSEAKGQVRYKRALEIAAAGSHNLLAFGPPGVGKTLLARRIPSIMTDLTGEEAVESMRMHSLAGLLAGDGTLICKPPFRAPHHSASSEGVLGGGRFVKPGEISLAHLGVLFLDEAPEFRINVLRALREPLEDGVVTISRAEGSVLLPADFQLILAANPCPCGRLGTKMRGEAEGELSACFCSGEEIARHWRKLGGALLDRIELRVPMTNLLKNEGENKQKGERSAVIALRVKKAVEIQRERFKALPCRRNARMGPALVDRFCSLEGQAQQAFTTAIDKLYLSGRAQHAVLRVARTIADLEGTYTINPYHILEAVEHRRYGDDPYDLLIASHL